MNNTSDGKAARVNARPYSSFGQRPETLTQTQTPKPEKKEGVWPGKLVPKSEPPDVRRHHGRFSAAALPSYNQRVKPQLVAPEEHAPQSSSVRTGSPTDQMQMPGQFNHVDEIEEEVTVTDIGGDKKGTSGRPYPGFSATKSPMQSLIGAPSVEFHAIEEERADAVGTAQNPFQAVQPESPPAAAPPLTWHALLQGHQAGEGAEMLRKGQEAFESCSPAQLQALDALIDQAAEHLAAGTLDRYYVQYERATTKAIRNAFPQRAISAMQALVRRGTDPARLEWAVTQSKWLDPLRHVASCETIYVPGWGASSIAGHFLTQNKNNATFSLLLIPSIIAFGGQFGATVQAKGGMGRRYTEDARVTRTANGPRLENHQGTKTGFHVRGLSFIWFLPLLALISKKIVASAQATPEDDKQAAIDTKATQILYRAGAGFVSSIAVGLHQSLLLARDRHLPWFDARTPEAEQEMFRTIDYLNTPMHHRAGSYFKKAWNEGVCEAVRWGPLDAATKTKLLWRWIGAFLLFVTRASLADRLGDTPTDGNLATDVAIAVFWGYFVEWGASHAAQHVVDFQRRQQVMSEVAAAPPVQADDLEPEHG